MRLLIAAVAWLALTVSVKGKPADINDSAIVSPELPASLAAYGFFAGGADKPSPALLPYALRTPLVHRLCRKAAFPLSAAR
jgi:hypothetical protein